MHIKELSIAEFDSLAKIFPLSSYYQSSCYALLMAEAGYDYEFIGNELKKEILKLIRDNDLTEYSDLIDLLEMEEDSKPEALEVATNHTIFFNAYLKSRRHNKCKNNR